MADSGVTTALVREILRGRREAVVPVSTASSVQRFSGADATTGALLTKLGTKVFEAANRRNERERRAQQSAEYERELMAQLEKLGAASQQMTPYQKERLRQFEEDLALRKPSMTYLAGPTYGGAIPVTPGQMIQLRGQDVASADRYAGMEASARRAELARGLARELADAKGDGSDDKALEVVASAGRILSNLPSSVDEDEVKAAALSAADDSLKKVSPWGRPTRGMLAERLAPGIRAGIQQRIEGERRPYLNTIDSVMAVQRAGKQATLSARAQAIVQALRGMMVGP